MKLKAWNIKQLFEAMLLDMDRCDTDFEKINCLAICIEEIRTCADKWSVKRKLTPGEISILKKVNNYRLKDFI